MPDRCGRGDDDRPRDPAAQRSRQKDDGMEHPCGLAGFLGLDDRARPRSTARRGDGPFTHVQDAKRAAPVLLGGTSTSDKVSYVCSSVEPGLAQARLRRRPRPSSSGNQSSPISARSLTSFWARPGWMVATKRPGDAGLGSSRCFRLATMAGRYHFGVGFTARRRRMSPARPVDGSGALRNGISPARPASSVRARGEDACSDGPPRGPP